MAYSVELVLDARAELGEGAIWDSGKRVLYWIDIVNQEVHVFSPSRKSDRAMNVGQMVGTVVPRAKGGLMVAVHHGFASLDPETCALTIVCDPEAATPNTRFNDGKCDPAGRFWAGTMDIDGKPGQGSLWRLDPDGCVHRMLSGVGVSNGIVWSLDQRTMYYIDTPTKELAAFDYEPATGAIANRRVAARFPENLGHPDGMTIDSEGMVWVAMFGSGRVTRWDPQAGRMIDSVAIPVSAATSCAFGGEALDELYVTTARISLDERTLASQPVAGGLFRVKTGVRGLPAFAFAG